MYQSVIVELNILGLLPDIDVIPIACALARIAFEAWAGNDAAAPRPRDVTVTKHKLAHITATCVFSSMMIIISRQSHAFRPRGQSVDAETGN